MPPFRSSVSEGGCSKQLVPWDVLQTGPERGDWLFWEPWNKQTSRIQHAVTLNKLKNSSNVIFTFNTATENKLKDQGGVLTKTRQHIIRCILPLFYTSQPICGSPSIYELYFWAPFQKGSEFEFQYYKQFHWRQLDRRNPSLETEGERSSVSRGVTVSTGKNRGAEGHQGCVLTRVRDSSVEGVRLTGVLWYVRQD